jgi:hypothetical protein
MVERRKKDYENKIEKTNGDDSGLSFIKYRGERQFTYGDTHEWIEKVTGEQGYVFLLLLFRERHFSRFEKIEQGGTQYVENTS